MKSTVFIIQVNPEIDDYMFQHGNISAMIRFFGQKSKMKVRLLLITPSSCNSCTVINIAHKCRLNTARFSAVSTANHTMGTWLNQVLSFLKALEGFILMLCIEEIDFVFSLQTKRAMYLMKTPF